MQCRHNLILLGSMDSSLTTARKTPSITYSRLQCASLIVADIPVWSKLQSNRVPQPQELLSIIASHMQFPAPGPNAGMSFNPANPPAPQQ